MINSTSLNNPKTLNAIKQATKNVINGYVVDHVNNRHGIPFLAVRIRDGRAVVTDRLGRDLAPEIANLI